MNSAFAMEFVPGETLGARLKRLDRFSPDAAMHIASTVLHALDYAHRLGVVHRDIKPGNVILTPSGTVKVMDFGIARVLGEERHTRVGAIVGTIAYMAPEQIQGHDVDQRADLYAVGTLLYEMLTGHVPFQADSDWARMQAHVIHPPRRLRGEVDVPEALEAAVLKSLEKAPDRRYQTAAEFQRALERVPLQSESQQDADNAATANDATVQVSRPSTGEEIRLVGPLPAASAPAIPPPSASTDPTRRVQSPSGLAVSPPSSGGSAPLLGGITPSFDAPTMPLTGRSRSSGEFAAPAPGPLLPSSASVHPPPVTSPRSAAWSQAPAAAPAAGERRATRPATATGRKALARVIAIAAVVVLIAAAVAGWLIWQRGQQRSTGTPPEAASTLAAQPAIIPSPSTVPAGAPTTPAVPGAPPAAAKPTVAPATNATGADATRSGTSTPGATTSSSVTCDQAAASTPVPSPAAPVERPSTVEPSTPVTAAPQSVSVGRGPVFKDVRIVRSDGREVEAELHFGPTLDVTNVGGSTHFHALDYADIRTAEYQEIRRARVLVRTTRHLLRLRGVSGWELQLRLERNSAKPVIGALEQRWGHHVGSTVAENEK